MAVPSFIKTWQFSNNIGLLTDTDYAVRYRRLIRTIKDTLIGFDSTPWTVEYSCDSATAGTAGDEVDRWSADSDIVEGAAAHSWIILKQTGILANFQICWDLSNADIVNSTIVVSPSAGFTGGTTSARPTATDEQVIVNNTAWGVGGIADNSDSVFTNIMMSSDGAVTRLIYVVKTGDSVGACSGFLSFEAPRNPVSGWTDPWISIASLKTGGSANGALTYAELREESLTANNKVFSVLPSGPTVHKLYLSSEGTTGDTGDEFLGSTNRNAGFNEISKEWEFYSMGLVCHDSPNRGRHGQVFDLWYAPERLVTGDTFPNTGTRLYAVIEDVLVPWGGVIVKV